MSPPTRRTLLQILGTAGIASLAGCPSQSTTTPDGERPPDSLGTTWTAPDDEWRFPRCGLRNTAHNDTTQERPTEDWHSQPQSADQGLLEQTHLAAATRDLVVLGTEQEDGLELTAYDAADGSSRWGQQLQDSDSLYPQFGGIVDGTLFLSDFETDVIAVNASDGTVRWRVDLYERVASAVPEQSLAESNQSRDRFAPVPAATPDCVYVQTSYGIHGLDPGDGTERWRLALGDDLEDDRILQDPGGLALTDGRVVASYGQPDRLLYGVRRDVDEFVVDRTTVPVQYPCRPLLTGTGTTALGSGLLWSTDAKGVLAAGAAGTSAGRWEFQGMASTGAAAFSSLAYDGTRVFVCEGHEMTEEFVVFALRADTGGLEWWYQESIPESGIELSPATDFRVAHPAVASDTLLVGYGTSTEQGSAAGTLIALSATDGTKRWRQGLRLSPRDIAPTEAGIYISGRRGGVSGLTSS